MGRTISKKDRNIQRDKVKTRKRNKSNTYNPYKSGKNSYEISPNPAILKIITKAQQDMVKLLKATDNPLLNRLFRKENIEKINRMPKEITDITSYTSTLNKEFKDLKKNKKNQPNQDYYDYVNNQWLEEQTSVLKKHPTYYVEVDDFRIVQDKVYREVIKYTDTFIKANPTSKKAKSIKAVAHCIENANKQKGLKYCKTILDEVNRFIATEDMYGLLAYTNQDEIFSWQSPIVWSVRPDEKNVKKYISHLSPPELGLYDYFIYIDDPADDKKTKEFKSTFRKKYFEFIEKTFKTVLPNDYKDFKAQDVWDVELDLLNAMGCDKIKKEDPNYYNVVTKDELEKDYGFNWTFFTEKLGQHTPFPGEYWVGKSGYKKPPQKVIVSSLNALKCTTELLKAKWSSKEWKTYWLFMFYKQMLRFHWD